MTYEETTEILTILNISYPNYYRHFSKQEANALIQLWSTNYKDVDEKVIKTALNRYLNTDTSGFPPTLGQINAIIYDLSGTDAIPIEEAMRLIKRAVRRATQRAVEDFKALPSICQKIVGNPGTLKEWAMSNENDFSNFTVPRLEKAYREIVLSEKMKTLTPAELGVLSTKAKSIIEQQQTKALETENKINLE